jgi:hypothetical protein
VREIIAGVRSVGVPARNIFVYDRYAYEMDIGSYQALVPIGVRVTGIQERKLDVSGYDPNVFCEANFFGEWETRSYMASIVSSGLSKIINVPTMKDHSAAGITGCLKNLGYGTFNNVDRSHRRPFSFTDPLIGIMCSVEPLRSKAVLHIMDGTRMVWQRRPAYPKPQIYFPRRLDHAWHRSGCHGYDRAGEKLKRNGAKKACRACGPEIPTALQMMAERFTGTLRKIFLPPTASSRQRANSGWEYPIVNRLNFRRSASPEGKRSRRCRKVIFDADGTRMANLAL